MFDEIELMSPTTPGCRWEDSFVRVWRLLRGLEQQHPGRISFFITGTNPRCVEVNRLGDHENPIYNYFNRIFLPRLDDSECGDYCATSGIGWV
jgi:serine/threonine-protein kinase